jgi:cell division protein ZipA
LIRVGGFSWVFEFRWALAGLGVLLIAGIWWWGARRISQASDEAELRDGASGGAGGPSIDAGYMRPYARAAAAEREWGVPPLEPLSIKTGQFDHVPVLNEPMMVDIQTVESVTGEAARVGHSVDQSVGHRDGGTDVAERAPPEPSRPAAAPLRPAAAAAVTPAVARVRTDESGRFATVAARSSNASAKQKIVSVRVSAGGESRWPGPALMAALEAQGLAFGRYQVYHRNHADGRSLFCVASLVEPGTFELARMAEQEFRGITAFAVLPGPAPPLQTVDALLATAHGLAESLAGELQDAGGAPLSAKGMIALREDVARFQAQLP